MNNIKVPVFRQFRLWAVILLAGLAACNSRGAPTSGPAVIASSSEVGVQATVLPGNTTVAPGTLPETSTSVLPVSGTPEGSVVVSSPSRVPGIELTKIDAGSSLDWVVQSGATWIRRNGILWSEVEPQEGMRQWEVLAGLEQELKNAAQRNLQVILIVRSTPSWAQGVPGYFCGEVAADKFSAFASFMFDLVTRYSTSPYNVKFWELGNEPDVDPGLILPTNPFGCWGDQKDAYYGGGHYAEMLKIVYPQIKAANPQAQVEVGGLLLDCDPINPPPGKDCVPSRFLEGILRSGGGDYFDGVAFHAYDYYIGPHQYGNTNWHSSWDTTGPVMIAKARFLRNLLAAYGHSEKYLMNTEVGLVCGKGGTEPECLTKEFELTKANYVAEAHAAALAQGLWTDIWFSLTGWRGTALIKGDKPTPAFDAYRFSASQLNGAVFVRNIIEVPGSMGYELSLDGKRVWILWSLDGDEHVAQFSQLPTAVYDVFGAPITPAKSLKVTFAPLYIEWTP